MAGSEVCKDIIDITELKTAKKHVCEECIKTGDAWVHLRTCQTCGVTLCCDESDNQHMTAHNHKTKHPVIISSEPGEKWMYCYTHKSFAEYA